MLVIYWFNKNLTSKENIIPRTALSELISMRLDFPYIACFLEHKTTEKRDLKIIIRNILQNKRLKPKSRDKCFGLNNNITRRQTEKK